MGCLASMPKVSKKVFAMGICLLAASMAGCSAAPEGTSTNSSSVMQADSEGSFSINQGSIPNSSSGRTPSTPEEVEMVASAAEELGVPFNGTIICTLGDPFFSEELGQEVRSISFYEDDKLCAGADCAEDGTPLTNLVYY